MTPIPESDPLNLDDFLPYRLAVLSDAVSRSVAQIYSSRFDLGRDEWRVLAALHNRTWTRTAWVIERTTLDKVSVSRALTRMLAKGLVERSADPEDGRGYLLRLTGQGRALYRKIVPMVRAREQFLLEGLADTQRAALESTLGHLLARARQLDRHG